jgi:hypothetical protein
VAKAGTIEALSQYLVQLQFPIHKGMSSTPEYLAVTRRGLTRDSTVCRLLLRAPERCRLVVHPTLAGRLPFLMAEERGDFENLVRALTLKNEPLAVPSSMGACIVTGYLNWHRLSRQHSQSCARQWGSTIPRLENRETDSFVILSAGPYSGVDAAQLGLEEPEWLRLSFLIRREHESAHYFVRRLFPSRPNSLMCEVMADYCAIRAVRGKFDADWLLTFFGLDTFPRYREGGRLQNYLTDLSLSGTEFDVVCRLLTRAVRNIEAFDRDRGDDFRSPESQRALLVAMSLLTIEEMSSPNGRHFLEDGCRRYLAAFSDKSSSA